jgi:SAM-dependent methyltransferase
VDDGPDEAVIRTRAAYESGAGAWASRPLDRDYALPRLTAFVQRAGAIQALAPQVLDLGCGPGFDSDLLVGLGARVTGLDITRAMLDVSASRPLAGKRLVQGDSRRLPFRDTAFGGVWASASLLHLPKAQAPPALGEIARVLPRGGAFASSMKEGDMDALDEPPPTGAVRSPRHFAHYRADEWTGLLGAAGFLVLGQEIDPDYRPGMPDWIVTLAVKRGGE